MPLNVRDARSSFLSATAEVEQWREEFLARWFQPDTDVQMLMFWRQLAPEVKVQLKQINPAAYEKAEQSVVEIEERMKANGTS